MALRGRSNILRKGRGFTAPAPTVQPVKEEVVSLASPFDFNATPFASTVTSPIISEPEPVKVIGSRTEPTQESTIPKASETGGWDSRIKPMIWDSAKGMHVKNPAYVPMDLSAINFDTLLEDAAAIQKEEQEKYNLIPKPENFDALASIDNAAQNMYIDEANKMIKDFGVSREDAEDWYSDIMEFTKENSVYGLDVNPELKSFKNKKEALQTQGYANKTNEWINELEGLREQDTASFTSSFNEMPTKNKLQYLYSAYEKGELTEDEYKENFKNTINANYDPQLNPNTNIIIDIKGNDYLVKANSVYGQHNDPFFLKQNSFYADDSLYFPAEGQSQNEWLQEIGAGQKSAENRIEDLLEPSTAEYFLNNPVTQVAGLVIPGFSAATTLAKIATDVDVTPMEIANTLLTGLDMAEVTKPPVKGVTGDKGTGLFGTTYGQTQTALNVAAAGDAKGAAIALVGNDLIKGGLDKVGLDQATIERAGIQYDDFEAGLGKTVQKLAAGEELDEALAHGLGKYIREGGTLGSIDLPESNIDLGVIEDVVRDIVRPIGKVGTALADFVEEAMPDIDVDIDIDTRALRPLEDVIKAGGRATEDAVRAAGSVIDDTVIQPIREAGKEFDDVVTQPVGDALSALDTAIRQALPDIDLPSVDLPSVDLPFDLLPSLMSDTGEDFIPSPTRTTDSLFNDELFQFETEIGISDYPIEAQEELELFYPESALQLDYGRDPDNFFENTIYEAKPRSYNF